jgi:Trypsin-co-occurring domain 1
MFFFEGAEFGFGNRRVLGGQVTRLVEFPLQDGGSVLVQVDEAAPGPVTRGLGDRPMLTEQARHTFEDAIGRVQPAAQSLISRLRALADAPDEVRLEFGLELSAEAGAFIASASSTANFRVTLSWRRDHPA